MKMRMSRLLMFYRSILSGRRHNSVPLRAGYNSWEHAPQIELDDTDEVKALVGGLCLRDLFSETSTVRLHDIYNPRVARDSASLLADLVSKPTRPLILTQHPSPPNIIYAMINCFSFFNPLTASTETFSTCATSGAGVSANHCVKLISATRSLLNISIHTKSSVSLVFST